MDRQMRRTWRDVYAAGVAMLMGDDGSRIRGRSTVSYPVAAQIDAADGGGQRLLRYLVRSGAIIVGIEDLGRGAAGEDATPDYPAAAQALMTALAQAAGGEADPDQLTRIGTPGGLIEGLADTLGPRLDRDRLSHRPAVSWAMRPWELQRLVHVEMGYGRAATRSQAISGLAEVGTCAHLWARQLTEGGGPPPLASAVRALAARIGRRPGDSRAVGAVVWRWGQYLLDGGDPRLLAAVIAAGRIDHDRE